MFALLFYYQEQRYELLQDLEAQDDELFMIKWKHKKPTRATLHLTRYLIYIRIRIFIALSQICSKIATGLNSSGQVDTILLDLLKAFDKVPHVSKINYLVIESEEVH